MSTTRTRAATADDAMAKQPDAGSAIAASGARSRTALGASVSASVPEAQSATAEAAYRSSSRARNTSGASCRLSSATDRSCALIGERTGGYRATNRSCSPAHGSERARRGPIRLVTARGRRFQTETAAR